MLAQRFDSKTKLKGYFILYCGFILSLFPILYCDCFNPVTTRRAVPKVVTWILLGSEDHLVDHFSFAYNLH